MKKATGFAIVVWITRYFGAATYGMWAFSLSFVSLFSSIADFGFSTLSIREIAYDKSKTAEYLDNILLIKIISASAAMGLIILFAQFLHKDSQTIRLIYFLGFYIVIDTFFNFFQSVFRANEKMQYEAACQIIVLLSLLVLVVIFALNNGSILAVSYAYIGATLVGIMISVTAVWRFFTSFLQEISIGTCKHILRKAWPFALSGVSIIIYYRIDSVMLGIFKRNEAVGYYNASYNIVFLVSTAVALFQSAIFPALSASYKDSYEVFKQNILRVFKFIHVLSFPLVIAVFFSAKLVISNIYGHQFAKNSPLILQILIWCVLFLYNYAIFAIGLSASGRQITFLKGVLYGAIFNIVTNLFAVPKYSYYGAAVTTVLTEILVCIYMTYWFSRFNNLKLPFGFVGKTVLSSSLMLFVIFCGLHYTELNILIPIILGFATYFVMLVLLKVLKKNILTDIRNLVLEK